MSSYTFISIENDLASGIKIPLAQVVLSVFSVDHDNKRFKL